MAKNILSICHQVQDLLLSSNMKSPSSLRGHFCAPLRLSCYDDNLVCGFKSNMVSKLIKHRKKRAPDHLTRKLTACLTGMFGNVVFLGYTACIKKGLKNK